MPKVAHDQNDVPIEISGYVTDPKLVGYQILTNYESTYWRALVGKDTWSLYEVLRSFCHEGNNTCNPSLKTLMAILGLTDRRQLIGRVDTKPGKEREIPGLIDTLHDYKLAYAEVKGSGSTLRYIFHVNLHPPALIKEQLQLLPKALQKKHDDLLQRVKKSRKKLEDIEQTKTIKTKKTLDSATTKGGGTVPPPPLVQYHPPPGTVPPKQQPITIPNKQQQKDKKDVVVVLTEKGLGKGIAQELVAKHSREYIFEKIEFLEYSQEVNPQTIKNPRGWLRNAIENDYGPPDGYKPREQREAEAAAAEERRQKAEKAIETQQAQARPKDWQGWLVSSLNVSDELQTLTYKLKEQLKLQMTEATFKTWVNKIVITESTDEQIRLAVPSQHAYAWLNKRLKPLFERTIKSIVGHPLNVEFYVLEQESQSVPD